jgi:hypothetical protein
VHSLTSAGEGQQCVLPLMAQSSFLAAAYQDGQIPSTAVGIYAGSNSVEHPDEGLVVVGGYDLGGFEGNLTNMEYDPDHPAIFGVDSLVYTNANNTTELLNGTMQVVGWYGDDYLTLPIPAFHRFMQAAGSTEDLSYLNDMQHPELLNWYDLQPGNFTVRLATGFEVDIPHYEVFRQQRAYSESGSLGIIANAKTEVFVSTMSDGDGDVYSWGMPFLSQVYLAFDHDRQTKRIAKARRLDSRLALIAGGSAERQSQTVCSPGGGAKGHSKGAIAGGVVGGLVSLMLALLCFWLLRRRRKVRRAVSVDGRSYSVSTTEKSDFSAISSPQSPTGMELSHSPSTAKSRNELPEKSYYAEVSGNGKRRWGPPIEMSSKPARDPHDELCFDKAEKDCLYELGLPTPTRAHFKL